MLVIWLHVLIGGITQIYCQNQTANVSTVRVSTATVPTVRVPTATVPTTTDSPVVVCDARIIQQPLPYIIDEPGSLTLTCNVSQATQFYWVYHPSGDVVVCKESNNKVNTCTLRPTREMVNLVVSCKPVITGVVVDDILCKPNIQYSCGSTGAKVVINQDPSPFVIDYDNENSSLTLTCLAENSTDSAVYIWKDQSGVFKNCEESPHVSTCTFRPQANESRDLITCLVIYADDTAGRTTCVPFINVLLTTLPAPITTPRPANITIPDIVAALSSSSWFIGGSTGAGILLFCAVIGCICCRRKGEISAPEKARRASLRPTQTFNLSDEEDESSAQPPVVAPQIYRYNAYSYNSDNESEVDDNSYSETG